MCTLTVIRVQLPIVLSIIILLSSCGGGGGGGEDNGTAEQTLSANITSPPGNVSIYEGESVNFQASISEGTSPYTFKWDFGGGATNSNNQNPGSVIFNTPGTYDVTFQVTDSRNHTGSSSVTIIVSSPPLQPLVAAISSPASNVTINTGQSVNFQGSIAGGSAPYAYQWSINGGSPSSSYVQNPGNVKFNTAGIYTVTFQVTDSSNQTDSATLRVTVSSTPPPALTASITSPSGPVTINPGQSVNFQGSASGGSGAYTYLWNFGGSGIASSTAQNPGSLVFNSPGSYSIIFTVTDSSGTRTSKSVVVNVNAVQPLIVGITSPTGNLSITVGQSVNFQGSVTGGLIPFTYSWTFDGAASNSSVQNPGNVTFNTAGTYTVNFQVSDSYNQVSGASVIITVNYPPLIAAIASPVGNVTINEGQSVNFQSSISGGSGTYTSFLWNFGGGANNSTAQNPGSIIFNNPGNYIITFRVTDSVGHSDTTPALVITVNDATPPTVTSTTPSNGATRIATNSVIRATFSEDIDPSTVTASTFIVTIGTGGITVPGLVDYSGATATFTPSSTLNSGTTYTAIITTGIKDLGGNSITSNYTWSFTTSYCLMWNKIIGGTAYFVQQTSDGGYILAGSLYNPSEYNTDAMLMKTDAHGNEVWVKTFGGDGYDCAYSVQQTSDGGYIVAGYTNSFGAGNYDAWLIKTDENGNDVWDNTLGGTNFDMAYSVQQTSDGGYILAGKTVIIDASLQQDLAWLIKTDENGNVSWDNTFGGSSYDVAQSALQTSDGGYILAGKTYYSSETGNYAWLIKTDADGNEIWDNTFDGSGTGWAYSLQQTSDGGYILAGWTTPLGNDASYYHEDAMLIKTDENGNEVWDNSFGGGGYDRSYSVQQTSDGGYILAGFTKSLGDGFSYAWLIKTDENGNDIWDRTFGRSNNVDCAYSVQQTSDGGYILAGEALLIKTDEYGNAPATP